MQRLTTAIGLGSIAQVAMVVAGHFVPAILDLFAVGGMGISAIAGWTAVRGAPTGLLSAAGQGGLAGGLCALIGIAVSLALGDVPASLLAIGTTGSTVSGALAGMLGRRR